MAQNSPHDLLATVTEATAVSIAQAYKDYGCTPLYGVFVCGGGAFNSYLLRRMEKHLKVPVLNVSNISAIPSTFHPQRIEAQLFAYLGYLTLQALPLQGKWTGALKKGSCASIIPGKNFKHLFTHLV
jgi:anhydro-N-acetylmuramic acid kinase